jgi:hypothetical protein
MRFEFEYLGKFEVEFKTALGYEIGAQARTSDEVKKV